MPGNTYLWTTTSTAEYIYIESGAHLMMTCSLSGGTPANTNCKLSRMDPPKQSHPSSALFRAVLCCETKLVACKRQRSTRAAMHRHGATKKVVLVLAGGVYFVMESYGRGCWETNAGDLRRYGGWAAAELGLACTPFAAAREYEGPDTRHEDTCKKVKINRGGHRIKFSVAILLCRRISFYNCTVVLVKLWCRGITCTLIFITHSFTSLFFLLQIAPSRYLRVQYY